MQIFQVLPQHTCAMSNVLESDGVLRSRAIADGVTNGTEGLLPIILHTLHLENDIHKIDL